MRKKYYFILFFYLFSFYNIASEDNQKKKHAQNNIILFDFNSTHLKQNYQNNIDEIFSKIPQKHLSQLNIKIYGHTDPSGDDQYNIELAYLRAKNVAQFLIKNYNIPSSSLYVISKGEEELIIDEDHIIDNEKSRRVEIKIEKKIF